ncbi:coiled-coil domain-containing protein [Nonomuraea sp. CA-141351]|uniref:coiled-coil domain-containing protein n=1 Tax=Nonomuraea sp. CA-141351 TaxID=3239996 RepID=UPI003D931B2F
MTVPTWLGRTAAAGALAVVASGATPGAAFAEPSPAKARAKLVKLNEQADRLVERYNQATETYKSAKEKYSALNAELGRKDARADALRQDLVTAAVNDYQAGPFPLWGRLIGQSDPQTLLGNMASLQQIAEARAAKIRAYDAATKELRDRRNEAKRLLAEAETARDKVRGEKAKVDKLVKEQTKLLRRLGAFNTGDPNSPGIVYTGPASGNARTAAPGRARTTVPA